MQAGDIFDTLSGMEGEARRVARLLVPPEDPDATYVGSDGSGTVRVTVDGEGQVSHVELGRGWRAHVPAGELGSAVQQAMAAAASARIVAWGDAATEAADAGDQPGVAVPPPLVAGDALARGLADAATAQPSVETVLNELLSMLEQAEAGLDQVTEQLEQEAARTYTGYGSDRHVSVSVNGTGDMVGVQYDERWLAGASDRAVAAATREAISDAYAQARQHGLHRVVAAGPLGEAQRLVQDPAALARRLGLTG